MEFGAEKIDLTKVQFTAELLQCIPPEIAHKYRVLPIREVEDCLSVALANADDVSAISNLVNDLDRRLDLYIADAIQLDKFLRLLYGER